MVYFMVKIEPTVVFKTGILAKGPILNKAHAWFHEITFVQTLVCVLARMHMYVCVCACACVCVCVCPCPQATKNCSHEMKPD